MKRVLMALAVAAGLTAVPLVFGVLGGARRASAQTGVSLPNTWPVRLTNGTAFQDFAKAEDAAHVSADVGVPLWGIRNEAAAQFSGADADYTPFVVDAYGALFARLDHPNRIRCTVTTSTATTIQAVGGSCVAPGAALSIYITDIKFSASAAGIGADAFPTLKYGTGGTCGTGTAVFWGALTAAAIVATDSFTTPIKIPANNEICWISSTAGSKFLAINGFIAP